MKFSLKLLLVVVTVLAVLLAVSTLSYRIGFQDGKAVVDAFTGAS